MIDPMLVRGTLLILLSAIACAGQFTIREVVNLVSARDPGVAAAAERAAAAHASVRLARTTYLPQANLLGQVNRATHNNVFGLLEPQPLPVISSITGPVLGTNNNDNVWVRPSELTSVGSRSILGFADRKWLRRKPLLLTPKPKPLLPNYSLPRPQLTHS